MRARNSSLHIFTSLFRDEPAALSTVMCITPPYDELERQKGVMMCIVRSLLGDFDFVERYRSDDFKTIFPKRTVELDKLAAVLPDLKRRYTETGSIV